MTATGLDPVAGCEADTACVEAMLAAVGRLEADRALGRAVLAQDGVAALALVQRHVMAR